MNSDVDLIIFTCEGRESLLRQTLESFRKSCTYRFNKIILAIDGHFDEETILFVQPDVVIQNPVRKGYVLNIINALQCTNNDHFFWLEDDWSFPNPFPLAEMLQIMEEDTTIVQVVLSKNDINSNVEHHFKDYYIGSDFSANPCLCKTSPIKNAFSEIQAAPKSDATKVVGFENYLREFMHRSALRSLIRFNNQEACVYHQGFLESTAREYHMINSLEVDTNLIGKEYISGFGYDKDITLLNKIGLLLKLWWSGVSLSIELFKSRHAYDFAFRIYLAYLKKFKN
ncbi:glycosyltransferase [Paradesertivirga mongoliensis]|uniref:Glycosyltransferase n=1 Tax=Paradesertivirga mongoliensis TaxID=2100740 RepID=A0ABW4ZG65_9SPHI|nr:glycosyltransferase [Pedobacter mongoliensis]